MLIKHILHTHLTQKIPLREKKEMVRYKDYDEAQL